MPETNKKRKILVIEARFYDDIADLLLEGACEKLESLNIYYDILTVPGALEIPPAIAFHHQASILQSNKSLDINVYDAYVALGCVIRGETYHFEIVANESARGLMNLGITHGLAIGNGILTVENKEQAVIRARKDQSNKGGGAAQAALDLLKIKEKLSKL